MLANRYEFRCVSIIVALLLVASPILVIAALPSGRTPGPGAVPATRPGPEKADQTIKLAIVTNNAAAFWKPVAAGVHQYEQEAGVKIDFLMPSTGTPDEQNRVLEKLVAQRYAGAAISMSFPAGQLDQINIVAEKMKLITFDSDSPASKRLAFVGVDNFAAGKVLGGQVVKLLPDGGKIAVFVGILAAETAKQRFAGLKAAIKGHHIEIVATREDRTDRVKAKSNVADVINTEPDLKLAVGLWSYNGPAIASAITDGGKKGKVLAVVFDEDPDTLKGIQDGVISCAIVQKPFDMGYRTAKLLHAICTTGISAIPTGASEDVGTQVIDATNVIKFKAELEKWLGP